MSHLHLIDEFEDLSSPSNSTKEFADRTLAALVAERTRRWTYLMVARTAKWPSRRKLKRGQRNELMLTHAEFRMLTALVMRADENLTNCFPRIETLAEQDGWSFKMAKFVLSSLVEKGWLVRHGEGGAKINQFCVPDGAINRFARGWKGPVSGAKRGPTKMAKSPT